MGIFGGGHKSNPAPAPAATPAPAPAGAKSTISGSAVAPGTNATDFRKQQEAYWNQLLSGIGTAPGGQLPASIQSNIERQASLIG